MNAPLLRPCRLKCLATQATLVTALKNSCLLPVSAHLSVAKQKNKLATLVTFTVATGALLPMLPNVKREWQQRRCLLSG